MSILPAWEERIKNYQPDEVEPFATYKLKKSIPYYAQSINFISTQEEARNMLEFAQQRPLSHIGFDTEFRYDKPGVFINKKNTAYDPRSIRPLLLSIALAEPRDKDTGILYRFVVDLRKQELLPELHPLFRLPYCFVGHSLKVELFCLWQLQLPEPNMVWDTFIHEKALYLGKNNPRYRRKPGADELEEINIKETIKEEERFNYSLPTTCQRYGISHAFAREKKRLQESFLTHGDYDPFSKEQIDYAAEDAITAARLYPEQVNKACQAGISHHLRQVEMPWTVTNARIQWSGVKVDQDKKEKMLEAIDKHIPVLEQHLNNFGLDNPSSHKQLKEFCQKQGILHHFKRKGKYCFDKDFLKLNQHLHPALGLIRSIRRAKRIKSDKIMLPEFVGVDGRMHPEHQQLGTDTGRQTSKWLNLLALDSMLRPLIVPEPGYAIGEVDLSQIEIGVAAAVYDDEHLIEMFNTGDVYSAMAQSFYRDELSAEDLSLSGKEFKQQFAARRNKMKTCTLGLIYGIKPEGLAQQLNTSLSKAIALQKKFMSMFPSLEESFDRAVAYGSIRGYAHTVSGLRRYRGWSGKPTQWEHNWMINHPVQGSAATVFKAAGNRLDKLYKRYDARIIIPLHDAFIFEAPMEDLKTVAALTARVMCDTTQEFFPMLKPRVEININNSECWNKDGNIDPLEKWIDKELIRIVKK